MITSTIQELAKTRAKVVQLELTLTKELASLPEAYGFDSLKAFIAALHDAVSGRAVKKAGKKEARETRKRVKITDAIRAKAKQLLKAGRSGSQIAKAVGISLPSVQNIKKALGLVRTSKKPARKPRTRPVPAKRAVAPKLRKKRVSPKKPAAPEAKPSQVTDESTPAPSA